MQSHDIAENDNFFSPPGGGWADFDGDGDLVTVSGGPTSDAEAKYLAYSTLMAKWLETPRSRLISFIRYSSCSPEQALALDRHIHWFEWEFNCFARNRRGIIKASQGIIDDLVRAAEEMDGSYPEAAGQFKTEVNKALELSKRYNSALARCRNLEERPSFAVSPGPIIAVQAHWQECTSEMETCDAEVAYLSDEARHAYGNAKYISWVENTIVDDLKNGEPVDEYDVTAIKEKLRSDPKLKLDDVADSLPMSWQKANQISEMSLSSGHETRNLGLQALTQGQGYIPEPKSNKRWSRLFGRRSVTPPNGPANGQTGQRVE